MSNPKSLNSSRVMITERLMEQQKKAMKTRMKKKYRKLILTMVKVQQTRALNKNDFTRPANIYKNTYFEMC